MGSRRCIIPNHGKAGYTKEETGIGFTRWLQPFLSRLRTQRLNPAIVAVLWNAIE